MDRLYIYGHGFPPGGARDQVFKLWFGKACDDERLPLDADAVLLEIREAMKDVVYETSLNRVVRLEREFDELQQGSLPFIEFRTLFQKKLLEMEHARIEKPSEAQLWRRFMYKLNPNLRERVMHKEFPIGPNEKMMRPTTWKEVARACQIVLEEAMDYNAVVNPTSTDRYCGLQSLADGAVTQGAAQKLTFDLDQGGSHGGQQGQSGGQSNTQAKNAPGAMHCKRCNVWGDHADEWCPQKICRIQRR